MNLISLNISRQFNMNSINMDNLQYYCLFALLMFISGCNGSTTTMDEPDNELVRLQQAENKCYELLRRFSICTKA